MTTQKTFRIPEDLWNEIQWKLKLGAGMPQPLRPGKPVEATTEILAFSDRLKIRLGNKQDKQHPPLLACLLVVLRVYISS